MRSFLRSIEVVYNKNSEFYNLGLPKLEIINDKNSKLANFDKLDEILIKFEEMLIILKKRKDG